MRYPPGHRSRRGIARFGAGIAVIVGLLFMGAAGSARAASCPWMNRSLSADTRATMLLRAMSLTQKVAMTYQRYSIFFHDGTAGWIPAVPTLCIPDLTFNDAGQGVGDQQTGTTAFPAPIAQSSSWDPNLQYQFGRALGQEAWRKGIDVQLAPAIETDRVPMDGRNWEYLGEDPFLSGQGGAAIVRGIQGQHVIATLKHFIANSQETDRGTAVPADSSDVDLRTLEEMYAPQYDVAIRQGGAMGVLCSYNRINGVYSCQDPRTLGMLDKQFGFSGFVVSDWGATHSTVASAKAGLDIEMNTSPGTYFGPPLQAAVQTGQVPMSTPNGMVRRILRAMFRVGVFDHPPASEPAAFHANVSTRAHVTLARRISEEGTVLLKNQGGILPLAGRDRKIAVIGPDAGPAGADNEYNGQGSGHVPEFGDVPGVVNPLQAITTRAAGNRDTVVYADGSDTAQAVAAAKAARVAVVFVGDSESEGLDRPNLTLTGGNCLFVSCTPQTIDQDTLIAAVAAANPNTIVVLDTGGPVLMPWVHRVKGIFEAWYPGQQDGNAIAALLFGDVDPSGHLPQTFPAAMSQLPIRSPAQWPGVSKAGDIVGPHSSYSERLLVGYRWYQSKRIKPLFAFGYGLSYTTFDFSQLSVRATRGGASASLTVTNTGRRSGSDVAQIYVGDPRATGEPPRQLKGYQRVSLRPGQSKRVTIPLGEVSFAYWSTRRGTWVVSAGHYAIYVGDSSQHLPLRATLIRGARRLSPSAY
jgi:beta-glucosidase